MTDHLKIEAVPPEQPRPGPSAEDAGRAAAEQGAEGDTRRRRTAGTSDLAAARPTRGPSLKIVVAEDDPIMGDFYREVLPRLGHQVCMAQSGRQLIEQCRHLDPDLVITDVRMPDLDGIAAAAEVGRERPLPIILVSAYHDFDLIRRAGELPVFAYLLKPIKVPDLEAAIALAMHRFEEMQALRHEVAELRQALEDRKLIERAKGILMRCTGVVEDEAFHRLQHLARNHNKKLVEVARAVLELEGALRPVQGDEAWPAPGA